MISCPSSNDEHWQSSGRPSPPQAEPPEAGRVAFHPFWLRHVHYMRTEPSYSASTLDGYGTVGTDQAELGLRIVSYVHSWRREE